MNKIPEHMIKKIRSLFFVLIAGLPLSGFAQQKSELLSVNELIKTGLDSSKSLKISQAKLQMAQAKYDQAMDATLPIVKLNANYTRLSDIEAPKFLFPGASEPVSLFPVYLNNYSVGISASETIFSGFRLKYAKESTNLLNDAAKFEFVKDREDIIFNLLNAYFNLNKLESSEKVIQENLKQTAERIRETELAEKNGLVIQNDLLRWKLQQSNLELTLLDIQNNLEVANYNLNLQLGQNPETKIEVDSNAITTFHTVLSLQEYMDLAAKNRNDLTAAQIRSNASFNNLQIAKNSYLPRITIQGEALDARPNSRYIPPVDKFNSTWAAGITFNWDLISIYSNKHNVDEYQSLYVQSKEGVNILSDAIKVDVNQNYLNYNEAIKRIQVMERSVVQSEENLRLTDSRYKNSLVILSELLEANNLVIQSKINLAIARADLQVAYYRLIKSAGNLQKEF